MLLSRNSLLLPVQQLVQLAHRDLEQSGQFRALVWQRLTCSHRATVERSTCMTSANDSWVKPAAFLARTKPVRRTAIE